MDLFIRLDEYVGKGYSRFCEYVLEARVVTEQILESVKSKYGAVAESSLSSDDAGVKAVAEAFGYSPEELTSIPAEANMGLSCGNPTATAHPHRRGGGRSWLGRRPGRLPRVQNGRAWRPRHRYRHDSGHD